MYTKSDTGNGWSITQTDFAGVEKKTDTEITICPPRIQLFQASLQVKIYISIDLTVQKCTQ